MIILDKQKEKNIVGGGLRGWGLRKACPNLISCITCTVIIVGDPHWHVHRQALPSVIPEKVQILDSLTPFPLHSPTANT